MSKVLDGKVALVTGGTLGIGRGVALGLANAGAKVAICGRHDEQGLDGRDRSMLDRSVFADVLVREWAATGLDRRLG